MEIQREMEVLSITNVNANVSDLITDMTVRISFLDSQISLINEEIRMQNIQINEKIKIAESIGISSQLMVEIERLFIEAKKNKESLEFYENEKITIRLMRLLVNVK